MWWYRLLNRLGLRKDTILCMRQANTWQWPPHLGEKTAGNCDACNAPIYYEKQNAPFRKICHVCGDAF
jgi:hypothetical protein